MTHNFYLDIFQQITHSYDFGRNVFLIMSFKVHYEIFYVVFENGNSLIYTL